MNKNFMFMILVFDHGTILRALIVLYALFELLYYYPCVSCDHFTWRNPCKCSCGCVTMTLLMLGHLISSMVIMMWQNGFEWLFEDPHNSKGSLSCLMSSFDMLYAHLDMLQMLSGHPKLNNDFKGSS